MLFRSYLGSLIAKARVEGFQGGNDWRSLADVNTVLACCKHFAAYGAAEAGRDYNTSELSQNTLPAVIFLIITSSGRIVTFFTNCSLSDKAFIK